MGLSCGLVGLPQSGKTVIFNAITSAGVSVYGGAETNRVVINLPDHRIDKLTELYHPRKTVYTTLEIVDIPGLSVSQESSSRSSKLLGYIKDVEALLHVVRCFDDPTVPFVCETINPRRDVETVDLELMAADSRTLKNKIDRTEKKAKSGDKDASREYNHCLKIFEAIQEGIPARKQELTPQEIASVKECNLVSLKPVVYIANIKNMTEAANNYVAELQVIATEEKAELMVICGKDEADISQLNPAERAEFLQELGLKESSVERLTHTAYKHLGLISFFTVGEDEVRAWTCHHGDKAPVAAGKIHSDMEKGFIRMEVIRYNDLIELGSEAAVAKAGKQSTQGKDYEVKDGDIVHILFNK